MVWRWYNFGRRQPARLANQAVAWAAIILLAAATLAMLYVAGSCVGPIASPAESQAVDAGGDATANQTQAMVAVAGALVDASARLAASVEQSASAGRDAATGGLAASQAMAGGDIYRGMDLGTVTVVCCMLGLAAWKTIYRMRLASRARARSPPDVG